MSRLFRSIVYVGARRAACVCATVCDCVHTGLLCVNLTRPGPTVVGPANSLATIFCELLLRAIVFWIRICVGSDFGNSSIPKPPSAWCGRIGAAYVCSQLAKVAHLGSARRVPVACVLCCVCSSLAGTDGLYRQPGQKRALL